MKRKTQLRKSKKLRSYTAIIIRHIFPHYRYDGDLIKLCSNIEKYRIELEKLHEHLVDGLRNEDFEGKDEGICYSRNPYSPIYNRYAYRFDDIEVINNNFHYISDRFMTDFRISYMLKLPDAMKMGMLEKYLIYKLSQ